MLSAIAQYCIIIPLLFSAIVTGFKTEKKQVALTFDACETRTPAYFDEGILRYIIENKMPATIFLSGKFIERNKQRIKELSVYPFIEFENHSYTHPHMVAMTDAKVQDELKRTSQLITEVTGSKPRYFRFPYGEYDAASLNAVEKNGYTVVHWTFPSGDPDKKLSKETLVRGILRQTNPGTIVIFHINRRGWKTAEALPEIVNKLKAKGYQLVLLKDVI